MIDPQFISIKIDSVEAAKYLPFAKNIARRRVQFGNFTDWKDMGDARIEVKCVNGLCSITITGAPGVRYEFFATDKISFDGGYGTPPYVGSFSNSYVCGHSCIAYGREDGFRATMGSSWTSLNDAPFLDPRYPKATDAPKWIGRPSYNNQKIAFHHGYTVRHKTSKLDRVEYSTTPAAGQAAIAHNRQVPTGTFTLNANRAELGGDVGWDVHQPTYRNSVLASTLQPLLPPPFWWRRGTTVIAKDDKGVEHAFSVVTDAMSNFYFFRTYLGNEHTVAQDPYVERYVPSGSYVKVSAQSFLPAWVELPTVDTMRPYGDSGVNFLGYDPATAAFQFDFPTSPVRPYTSASWMPGGDVWAGSAIDNVVQVCEYLWVFNSDGSEAAAIVHEDKGPATYPQWSADVDPANPPPNDEINVMRWGNSDLWVLPKTVTEKQSYLDAHGKLETIHIRQRGLIAVSISIAIHGDGPVDFTPTVTVNREIRDRHFLDVGFAINHPTLSQKGVTRDALIAAEVEIYLKDNTVTKYDADLETYNLFTVRNLALGDTPAPLVRWAMSTFKFNSTHIRKVACVDLGNLARVTQHGSTLQVPPYGGLSFPSGDYDFNMQHHELLFTFKPPFDTDPSGYYGNGISAMDLKSLSFVVTTNSSPHLSNRGVHLYVFGDLMQSSGPSPSSELSNFPDVATMLLVPESPSEQELIDAGVAGFVPYDYWVRYDVMARFMAPSQATHLLDVHPSGHYSAYAQYWASGSQIPDPVIDVVAHCSVDSDGRVKYRTTSHRALFNKAFAQQREYADYSVGGQYEFGMFASAGMWV